MAFQITGLRLLHQDMIKVGETRAVFPFEYNRKPFSCIFLIDTVPARLYLTTLGTKPLSLEFEVNDKYETRAYIERKKYFELLEYLDLKPSPDHKFSPVDVLEVLNCHIPSHFTQKPDYREAVKAAAQNRDIEEPDKIYFCGWLTNPPGKTVTTKNYEKTRAAFGDREADARRKQNISSKWTDDGSKENLSRLNDMY